MPESPNRAEQPIARHLSSKLGDPALSAAALAEHNRIKLAAMLLRIHSATSEAMDRAVTAEVLRLLEG